MTDADAKKAAKRFREQFLLIVALAVAGKQPGAIKEACDAAETDLVRLLTTPAPIAAPDGGST